MTKLQMNLEILQALTHFGIKHTYYSVLKTYYGGAEALHVMLGNAFENGNAREEMNTIINACKKV